MQMLQALAGGVCGLLRLVLKEGETLTRRRQPCEGLLGPTGVRGGFAGCALRGSAVRCCDSSCSSWASPSV